MAQPSHDPDATLDAALARRGERDAQEQAERDAKAERVRSYAAERQRLLHQLSQAGARMLERLLAGAGSKGRQFVVVERRRFGREEAMVGWLLRRAGSDGGVLLLSSGEVVWYGVKHDGRHGIQRTGDITAWVDTRLSRAQGNRGDRPPGENDFLDPASAWYGDKHLHVELKDSLARIELEITDTYAELLARAGRHLDG